jgi:hypothetical protein
MMFGCGDSDCVSKTNRYFCSKSCKNAAIRDRFIDDNTDIDYDESALLLTEKAHERLFVFEQPSIINVKVICPNTIIGCGDHACVSKTNLYFCSKSCKNAAIRDHFIDDNTDIEYEISNLLLTEKAHKKIFNKV